MQTLTTFQTASQLFVEMAIRECFNIRRLCHSKTKFSFLTRFYASCKELITNIQKREKPESEAQFISFENVGHNFDKLALQSEEKISMREEAYDRVLKIIKSSYNR